MKNAIKICFPSYFHVQLTNPFGMCSQNCVLFISDGVIIVKMTKNVMHQQFGILAIISNKLFLLWMAILQND